MPGNQQDELVENKQECVHSGRTLPRSQQKPVLSSSDQSPAAPRGQRAQREELKLRCTSHLWHRQSFVRERRKDPGSVAWRAVTGILGVLCMILMTRVGVWLPKLFSCGEDQSRQTSLLPTSPSENDECPCDLGSHSWIGFGNSYYHVSSELKTWEESRAACSDLNAHLLKTDTEEERDVLSIFEMEGWIDTQGNEMDGSWSWEDGTHWKPSLFAFYEQNHDCAYLHRRNIYSQDCLSRNVYICECNVSQHLSY